MTIPQALVKLSRSAFRGRFKLNEEMRSLVEQNGLQVLRDFALNRVATCLAPANPPNDGHQTPLKGHPVFLAQHATATCCRTCLNHWWRVTVGVEMTIEQQIKIVNLQMAWIEMQMNGGVGELLKTMNAREIAEIPFWRGNGTRFQCPYRKE